LAADPPLAKLATPARLYFSLTYATASVAVVVGLAIAGGYRFGWWVFAALAIALLWGLMSVFRRIDIGDDDIVLVAFLPLRKKRVPIRDVESASINTQGRYYRAPYRVVTISAAECGVINLPAVYGLSYASPPLSADRLAAIFEEARDGARARAHARFSVATPQQ